MSTQIEMKYNKKSTKVLGRHGKQHDLQYADPETLKQLKNENLDDEARQALLQQAEHQHHQELRRRKREAIEKRKEEKLESIDKGGSMAPGALMELMKDENLVERYSKHVIAILFSYQDEFMK